MLYKSNYYSRHHHFKMVSFSSAGSGTSLQCCTCSTSTYTQSVYEVKTLWGHLIVMCGNESCTTQPAFLTGQKEKRSRLWERGVRKLTYLVSGETCFQLLNCQPRQHISLKTITWSSLDWLFFFSVGGFCPLPAQSNLGDTWRLFPSAVSETVTDWEMSDGPIPAVDENPFLSVQSLQAFWSFHIIRQQSDHPCVADWPTFCQYWQNAPLCLYGGQTSAFQQKAAVWLYQH